MTNSQRRQPGETLSDRQTETFIQVNRFISTIDNLEELLRLIMRESVAAVALPQNCHFEESA